MKNISTKLPLKIFKKKSSSLSKALAPEKDADTLSKSLDRVLRRLWTLPLKEAELEIKSLTTKLELSWERSESDPVSLLRSINTLHRILLEGPPTASVNSNIRATLHFFGKVGSELSNQADSIISKRLYHLASQYSNLCHERLELYRVYGSMLSPDWSLSALFSADERDTLLALIPEREPGGTVVESSESPELTTKEPAKASCFGALKAFMNHAVSQSLILSRVSSHMIHTSNWASELTSTMVIECRSNLKILSVLSVCVALDQLMPKADLERYSNFIKNYPISDPIDETSVWSGVRQSAERVRKIGEKRFTRVSKIGNVSLKRLCGCQYARNGGEMFLLTAAINCFQSDLMTFYFDDDDQPGKSLNDPKVAYGALLKLHTNAAPASLKKVTALYHLQDALLTFYDSVKDNLKKLATSRQLSLLTIKSASSDQVIKMYIKKKPSAKQPGSSRQSALTEGSESPDMPDTLVSSPGVARVVSFNFQSTSRKHSEDSTAVPTSAGRDHDNEQDCEYLEIHDCRQIPILFLSPQTVPHRLKNAVAPTLGSLPSVHMLVTPELLPDRRMIVGLFDCLKYFLDAVRAAQFTMLSERRRNLNHKIPRVIDSNPVSPNVQRESPAQGAATCRHSTAGASPKFLLNETSPKLGRGRYVVPASPTSSAKSPQVSRGVPEVVRATYSSTPMLSPLRVADVQTIQRPSSQQFKLERDHVRMKPTPLIPATLPQPVRGRPMVITRSVSARPVRRDVSISSVSLTPPTIPSVSTMAQHFHCVDGPRSRSVGVSRSASRVAPSHLIPWNDIQMGGLIGRGSTADVYRGTWQGTEVAVKVFKNKTSASVRESSIVFGLRHPNLVLVMAAVCEGQGISALVTEYCSGGSLFDVLRRTKMKWTHKHCIALDVAKGCNYLHTQGIIHRDLKSLNILLTQPIRSSKDRPSAKISDFGTWCDKRSQGLAGTFQWMAPEVLLNKPYDSAVDVWSFGIFLFELAAQEIPYERHASHLNPAEIGHNVATRGLRPDLSLLPTDCPQGYRVLMQKCWRHDPRQRPTFTEIIHLLSS